VAGAVQVKNNENVAVTALAAAWQRHWNKNQHLTYFFKQQHTRDYLFFFGFVLIADFFNKKRVFEQQQRKQH
jgi:hypothetical protein